MSDWVHYTEDGYVEYGPCGSDMGDQIYDILEPSCRECVNADTCCERYGDVEGACEIAGWLVDEITETPGADEYRIKCPNPPDDKYDGGEILAMLNDAGIFPYRDIVLRLDAAVTSVLTKHHEVKLARPKRYWLEGEE